MMLSQGEPATSGPSGLADDVGTIGPRIVF